MNHRAERCAFRHLTAIDNLAVNAGFHDVTHTSRTVVIEIIVTIDSVFGQPVLVQGCKHAQLFRSRKVQFLLDDTASVIHILTLERFKRAHTHLIIRKTEHETEHKKRFVEIEHAIVHGNILTRLTVLDTHCGMPIKAVHLLMRRARQKIDVDRIRFHPTLRKSFRRDKKQQKSCHKNRI